ncbi:unnamed protein product [Tetraodon nigroviridis]|uniref:(spotted green pufferfish) hypothetical protein n=1 Tax=Tetraodon nigroviridis TaxID=99883 RepID=Q4RGU6_TETNG|nr:unnamed protein product [Tetraodon nigroviridis]
MRRTHVEEQHPTFNPGVKLPMVAPDPASSAGLRPSRSPKMQIYIDAHDLAKIQ